MIRITTDTIKYVSNNRKLKCPHCKGRLGDVPATPSDQHRISVQDDINIDLLIKCPHCGILIGINIT